MTLSKTSDQELLVETKKLVAREQEITHQILEHLEEIEVRKLYSDLRYSSLFEYCMRELGYSEDESYRRISAMRFLRKNPEVTPKVQKGELTLSTLNLLDKFQRRSDENIMQVANEVSNKSKREVEKILDQKTAPEQVKPKEQHKITISDSLYQKLLTLQKMNGESIETLIDKLAEKELTKNIAKKETKPTTTRNSRYIPISVRTNAIKIASNRCTQCGSNYKLEFNHKIPFAKDGARTKENINLLCRSCNQRQLVIDFGPAIRRKYLRA